MLTILFKEITKIIPVEFTSIFTIALFGVFIITPTYFIVNLVFLSAIGLVAYTMYTVTYYMLNSYIQL